MKRRDAMKLLGLSAAWPVGILEAAEVLVDEDELAGFKTAQRRAARQGGHPRVYAVERFGQVLGSELLVDVETVHLDAGIWLTGPELEIPIIRSGRLDHLELEAPFGDPAGGLFRFALETPALEPREVDIGDQVRITAPHPGGRMVYVKIEVRR